MYWNELTILQYLINRLKSFNKFNIELNKLNIKLKNFNYPEVKREYRRKCTCTLIIYTCIGIYSYVHSLIYNVLYNNMLKYAI